MGGDPTVFRMAEDLRFLIVAENTFHRRTLGEIARRIGINNITAKPSVAEALECIEQLCPQVVLAEMQMTDGDGFGLAESIRAHKSKSVAGTILLLVTAAPDERSIRRAYGVGADACLALPLAPQGLLDTLKRVKQRRAAGNAAPRAPLATQKAAPKVIDATRAASPGAPQPA